jgi:hypothetical protein
MLRHRLPKIHIGIVSKQINCISQPRLGTNHPRTHDMESTNGAEDLQRTLLGDPGRNEVIHPERIDVAKIQRRKSLWCLVAVALGDVAINTDLVSVERLQT